MRKILMKNESLGKKLSFEAFFDMILIEIEIKTFVKLNLILLIIRNHFLFSIMNSKVMFDSINDCFENSLLY
jgi:hypothetical protein